MVQCFLNVGYISLNNTICEQWKTNFGLKSKVMKLIRFLLLLLFLCILSLSHNFTA
ncbi:MAG: hypothetical protein K0S32_4117 [Bacteroidetes bacterium]|nr:hypothetical protein [Bacteroidota bacterium]